MKLTYSAAFIEQALVKVYSRGNRTIQSVAEELNINHYTVKNWMSNKIKANRNVSRADAPEKRPQDWRAEEQLLALQESYVLTGEALHAWCRERGLFAHHLDSWKASFCSEQKSMAAGPLSRELRGIKDENDQLKRELLRKEKALAEAAALLILQKKFRALWEDEVK